MGADLLISAAVGAVSGAIPAGGGRITPGSLGSEVAGAAPFSGVFQDAMANLQGLEVQATSAIHGLVSGRGVDIHAAMIATQKSDLAFEMALAVRGKMVSAYQAMMGLQF